MGTLDRPFFPYFGGKSKMLRVLVTVVSRIPHKAYVEVFGGAANLLLRKPPSPVEVYNDIDGEIVNLFRVVADPSKFEEFYRRVAPLPVSRQMYYDYLWSQTDGLSDVERAVRAYYVLSHSFSGVPGRSWSFTVSRSMGGMAEVCSKWLSRVRALPEVHARLQRVVIERRDFRDILRIYDRRETLFYLDPPYVFARRRAKEQVYGHEMTLSDHRDLVRMLLSLRGSWVLSCYDYPVYRPLREAGASVGHVRRALSSVKKVGESRGFAVETVYVMDKTGVWKGAS